MTPERLNADDSRLGAVLDLIRRNFAYMEGRIDPPSSVRDLTLASLTAQCHKGEIWIIGAPLMACMFLTPKEDCLYLGKLAVDGQSRGRGLARLLIDHAVGRAQDMGLPAVELQTRVELVENHETFARLGFIHTGSTAHPGFSQPTSLVFRRSV